MLVLIAVAVCLRRKAKKGANAAGPSKTRLAGPSAVDPPSAKEEFDAPEVLRVKVHDVEA